MKKALAVIPVASLAAVQAAYASMSDTGNPGPVFESTPCNASGNANDAATHYIACFHVGEQGEAALPGLKAAIAGADYYGPFVSDEFNSVLAMDWLLVEHGVKPASMVP